MGWTSGKSKLTTDLSGSTMQMGEGITVSGSSAITTVKSTANGTINLGPGNSQNDTFTGSTGDMDCRAGKTVATLDTELLANNGSAYWRVSSSKVLATDTIVVSCTTEWVSCAIFQVKAGEFFISATNYTGGNIAKDATITVNWVAL
jgi:hypothetical protein